MENEENKNLKKWFISHYGGAWCNILHLPKGTTEKEVVQKYIEQPYCFNEPPRLRILVRSSPDDPGTYFNVKIITYEIEKELK